MGAVCVALVAGGALWAWRRRWAVGGPAGGGSERGVELSSSRHKYEPVPGGAPQGPRMTADEWNRAGGSPRSWDEQGWDEEW